MPRGKERAADHAERLLIEGILDGTYPPGGDLPGERVLCKAFGVARPALREALQRLSRDGWLSIQQGKPTHVADLSQEGTLSILTGMLKVDAHYYGNFVPDVLEMWAHLAAEYTASAVRQNPESITRFIEGLADLDERSEPTVHAMWQMHHHLIALSGNLVYALIFNSFSDFYRRLSLSYYRDAAQRDGARSLWHALTAAVTRDAEEAGWLIRDYILETRNYWIAAGHETDPPDPNGAR